MISKSKENHIRSLYKRKYRKKYDQFIIEGYRSIIAAVDKKEEIDLVIISDSFIKKHPSIIKKLSKYSLQHIDDKTIQSLSALEHSSGILAIANTPRYNNLNYNNPLIYLDEISDPGNLGTMLRTANWFDIKQIAFSKNCVDPFNTKVIRAAMGAHFSMEYIGYPLIKELIKFTLIGADYKGEPLSSISTPKNWCLIMGNEARGISNEIKNNTDKLIGIPKIGQGESLNVGVAMGVILYELTK